VKDKELFQQLHNLGKMKPDVTWKESQRNILLSQINVSKETEANSFFRDTFRLLLDFVHGFSQPVIASFLVSFLFLTGGFVGLRAAQETKPGDSLYLAKIVGEKTQLALAFTDKKKLELGLGFVARRAEEIKQVIATEEVEIDNKDEKVGQLIKDFKKEISAAKLRIEKISEDNNIDIDKVVVIDKSSNEVQIIDEEKDNLEEQEQEQEVVDSQIFSAGLSKIDKGLQISDNNDQKKTVEAEIEPVVTKDLGIELEATSTKDIKSSTTEEVVITETTTAESILEQASALLEAKKYDEIVDILNDVGEFVEQSLDQGEVKGVEESIEDTKAGTSTEE